VVLAEPSDVDSAVQVAKKAFASWRDVSLTRRACIMFAFRDLVEKNLDALAEIVSAEHGKVLSAAKGEVIRGMDVVEFACGIPQLLKGEYSEQVSTDVDAYSFRQPLGVCAGISGMGPVVTAQAKQRILGYVERGAAAGATLVVDGRNVVVEGHENGFFVDPCLFDRVTTEMDIYTDEIFGPVLVVLRADTFDEAINMINANPYGNGTAVFTSSGQAARKFERHVRVGMIGINVPIPVPMAFYSFGGWKDSLFGDTHIHGPEGCFYTRARQSRGGGRTSSMANTTAPTCTSRPLFRIDRALRRRTRRPV
jgi:acyl-CoA reductase-like NAD-dependent aldehyde dehydrogenase